jgi:hypothetical protein
MFSVYKKLCQKRTVDFFLMDLITLILLFVLPLASVCD